MATTARSGRRDAPQHRQPTELGGWGAFAGCMLFLAGIFTFLYGLGAVLNDEAVTVGGRGVIVWDFTVWGWVHIVLGLVGLSVAWGLFTLRSWGRWGGVFFALVNAIAQLSIISAFPVWALIVIALDVIVIYHLTARWYGEARS